MLNFDPTVDARFGPPISICDLSGRRLLVSDSYAAIIRRSKDDLTGIPWPMIAHLDDLHQHGDERRRLAEDGVPFSARWRLMRGDGVWIGAIVQATRIIHPRTGDYCIQGNMQLEQDVGDQIVDSDGAKHDCAEYIRAVAAELSELAGSQRMRFLQHLLTMASAEAALELKKRLKTRASDQTAGSKLLN